MGFAALPGAVAMPQVTPCEFARLLPSQATGSENFGFALDIDGDRVAIGAIGDFDGTLGATYLLTRNGLNWYSEAELRAPDGVLSNGFGEAVALRGDLLVVGASRDDDVGANVGAVYVFELTEGLWAFSAKLLPADATDGAAFGDAVATDGTTILVGGRLESTNGASAGAAWVFERQGPVWGETAKLLPTSANGGDNVGCSVAVDGERLVLGAYLDSVLGNYAGAAWIFEKEGGLWSEKARLEAPAGQAFDEFGKAVDLVGDRVLIGAPGTGGGTLSSYGAAHIFEGGGTLWSPIALLNSSDDRVFMLGDSVALSAGGDQAVVGAPGFSNTKNTIQIFTEDAGWALDAVLQSSDGLITDDFGAALAVSGDLLAVGAFRSDVAALDAGSVYTFSLDGTLCPTLAARPESLSLSAGGTQVLRLTPGPGFAGQVFVLVGSASGTDPGLAVGGLRIPLNPDDYFFLTLLAGPGTPLEVNTGLLSAGAGSADVDLVLPPGTDPSLVGTVLDHAFVILGGGSGLMHVSNPVSLRLDS